MAGVDAHREVVGVKPLCDALAVSRETYYRRKRPPRAVPTLPRRRPPRALNEQERAHVLDVLCSERFADRSATEVYATLLDEGICLCSLRTMYRVLKANRAVRERRNQLRHPNYKKPELLATGPNQVWSWDITKLLGPVKWSYFHLYVVLDIFSRYVVGWMLARSESAELARRLLRETCEKHDIKPDELVVHSDRGSPMTSKTLGQLLADLGVEKSFSRPRVSNDNPFSESAFKTLKYSPGFPDRFTGGYDQALSHCRSLLTWYNNEHHHSGLVGLTPAQVHFGRSQDVLAERQQVLRAAYDRHPDRFVRGLPRVTPLPSAVWINPPKPACAPAVFTHEHSLIS